MTRSAATGHPSVVHGSFTIERELPHTPERVFAAWFDPVAKAAWFAGPGGQWKPLKREMDFRIGGREHGTGSLMVALARSLER
jgi:uncharacterized protein YndB with AHSA1/START domain